MTVAPLPEPTYDGTFVEAEKLLSYVGQAADEAQIELPQRRFVTVGQAVHDCPQVSAAMVAVLTGMPGAVTPGGAFVASCPVPWQMIVELSITRDCAPIPAEDGTPPSPQQLSDSAQIQSRDTHILQEAVSKRAAEQFGSVGVTISYPAAQGAYLSTVARVTMAVSQ